ncbi:hypothetical protein ABI118_15435, partial [Enterococcus faecium]|uniref:hypothetical protein n=1 Tax=Enterococcus faecium TaxID=1352 RepID=UPI003F432B1F
GVLAVLNQDYKLLLNPDEATVRRELADLTPPQQLLINATTPTPGSFTLHNMMSVYRSVATAVFSTPQ